MKHAPKDYVVMFVVFGISMFIFTAFSSSLDQIGKDQVALVSEVGATVTETPINKLAAELRDKSNELTLKEKMLNERESILIKEKEIVDNRVKNILMTTILLSLVTLLIVNGYIYKRSKNKTTNNYDRYGHSLDYTGSRNFRIDLHHNTK